MGKRSGSPMRVFLADDHELFRSGIAGLLNEQSDFQVVGQAGDGLEAQYRAAALNPDIILLDINMPGVGGLEAIKLIRGDLPEVTIVMLTVHDEDEKVFQALQAGANGYILKNTNSTDFLRMLRGIWDGEAALSPKLAARILSEFTRLSQIAPTKSKDDAEISTLTRREKEVLAFVGDGLMDKEIADSLSISVHTVKSHMRNILAKLQVENRHAAANYSRNTDINS